MMTINITNLIINKARKAELIADAFISFSVGLDIGFSKAKISSSKECHR